MSAEDAFQRMHSRLFARLGRQASLQSINCIVMIEHGVETTGQYGEVTGRVSVATLPAGLNPKLGDSLVVGSDQYILDAPLKNDGYTAEYTLRRA